MPPPEKYRLITVGLVVHAVLVLAVFDVYFSSPIESGSKEGRSPPGALAKRAVLFVADGLRAEAVFDETGAPRGERMPYLSGLIGAGEASWGVSETRVPTESRPGHVAILAGIYEDPSAILKGWKANIVEFDSLIKRSARAFCWGSPDILNLFTRPDSHNLQTHTYDPSMEDFASGDTTHLDSWVFEKVREFFRNGERLDSSDDGGDLYFLHLLGIDTAGHGHKPSSRQYVENVRFVDENVRTMAELFRETFPDDSTAFVFTSDHGMTEWGSHGSGTPHETQTPMVAWGAGVMRSKDAQNLEQIDIAPLMASLIGARIPVDSLGVVPMGYLDCDEGRREEILRANVEQLKAIYTAKRRRIEKTALIHIEWSDVDDARSIISGIRYYHDYYKYPVLLSVGAGFLLWIVHLTSLLVPSSAATPSTGRRKWYAGSVMTIAGLCYFSEFSWRYYLYFLFPVVSYWYFDFEYWKVFGVARRHLAECFGYFLGVELLVYGFYDRRAYSALLLPIWWCYRSRSTTNREMAAWTVLCGALAIFPALPVMRTGFDATSYLVGYVGWCAASVLVYVKMGCAAYAAQIICMHCACAYVVGMTYWDMGSGWAPWVLASVPVICIGFGPGSVAGRLAGTFLGLAPFYLLVSTGYEVIFSLIYCIFLSFWLTLETKTVLDRSILVSHYNFTDRYKRRRSLNVTESDFFIKSFTFVSSILLGFFGTGSVASLNSFDPMWTRAFVTVFDPFAMASLVVLKVIVPFVFACCALRAVDRVSGEDVLRTFVAVLGTSDAMVLNFLFLVRNEGSWLEIGTSLSHFLIMDAFVVVLLALYGIAHVVTTVKLG